MSKLLNKNVTALDYADKTLLVWSCESSGVSLCLFTTVIATPIAIKIASVSLVFLISNEIVKMFLKAIGKKKSIAFLTRSY